MLDRARRELAEYYPVYADFEPLLKDHSAKAYKRQPMKLVPLKEDGTPDIDALNAEFSKEYLSNKRNPRWVAKPTVAYLWARTVTCKNCRATLPLLKTRWLCKKPRKRVLLTMGPVFGDAETRGGGDSEMLIANIHIRNYRCFGDTSADFHNGNTSALIFVISERRITPLGIVNK